MNFKKQLCLLSIVACFFACTEGQSPSSNIQKNSNAQDPVLAEFEGKPILESEVKEKAGKRLSRLEDQIFEVKKATIENIIETKLLESEAKKRGVSLGALLKTEVQDKVIPPTDEEVTQFYEQNKKRFFNQRSNKQMELDEVKPYIVRSFNNDRSDYFRENLIEKLSNDYQFKIHMRQEFERVEVSVDDDPSKGPKNAKITIVEFTDYECPFCVKARGTIKKLLETYPNDIHYVLRDYPLPFHPHAQKSAEAAQCAGDQGKYWEYSEVLWENQKALDISKLNQYAKNIDLNMKEFDDCLKSNKYAAEVKKDAKEGSLVGVTGTPAFFVNGIPVTGARPFKYFKSIIEDELRRIAEKG